MSKKVKRIDLDEKRIIEEFIKIREDAGLTQDELSKLSGVNKRVISKIENFEMSARIDTLVALLAPMGYTLSVQFVNK